STVGSFETTPIEVAEIMYITSPAAPNNIVRAFDLRTQKMLWHYEHKNGPVSTACCGPNNRGGAASGGAEGVGTADDYHRGAEATTAGPHRSWGSIRPTGSSSGATRKSPTTCGTWTR